MNPDRYLKIANYLRKRYTQAGSLIVQRGRFMSLYAALDYAAARRYLGI
jgi:hypothetical protein